MSGPNPDDEAGLAPSGAAEEAQRAPAVRLLVPPLAAALTLGSLAWAGDLYRLLGLQLYTEQFLAAMLGLGLSIVFLNFPARRGGPRDRLPWYDAVAAAVGLATGAYVAMVYPDLMDRVDMVQRPVDALVVSFCFFFLCIEGLRRTAGYTLVIVVLLFALYALVGHLVPGKFETREVSWDNLLIYLSLDTSALFGFGTTIAATIVFSFVFFGQLLLRSGGSEVFNDIAVALMGRFRGGSAKIAITASSMFGSISGLAASNILATGVVTIPLMRRAGYPSHVAAAIEAVASTGGQIMPPVMGAVAFLMAEILGITYGDVVLAAAIPAVLYYVALFILADLEAAKLGISRVDPDVIPRLLDVLKRGWPFVIPFAVLILGLFEFNLQPESAALYAGFSVIVIGFLLGYKGTRMTVGSLLESLSATGTGVVDVLMIVAAAGFILGVLNLSSFGFILTNALVTLGRGNLIVLLVMAAVICIVLGMGMPTIGVYILLAVLIAPSLVEVGIDPLAAHMFIFYFGMMSLITPPVAIAAFFAANLAQAPPMRTGFAAMRFGWTAYIVPFLFVFSPSLLFRGGTGELLVVLASAVGGVWLVSAGFMGYFTRPLAWPTRVLFIIAGILLMMPWGTPWGVESDIVGVALAILLVTFELRIARQRRVVGG